jgi:hypothetical protein
MSVTSTLLIEFLRYKFAYFNLYLGFWTYRYQGLNCCRFFNYKLPKHF